MSEHGGRTYYVSYQFVDMCGIAHKGDDPYPFPDWSSLRHGALIGVTYFPDDPERNNLTRRVQLITARGTEEEITRIGVPWIIADRFFIGYLVRKKKSRATLR